MSGKNQNFDDKKSKEAGFIRTKRLIILEALMLIIY